MCAAVSPKTGNWEKVHFCLLVQTFLCGFQTLLDCGAGLFVVSYCRVPCFGDQKEQTVIQQALLFDGLVGKSSA